jgi:hypothetical protein
MVESLARLHAALFDAPPEAIRRSAELRAQAAVTVDRITGGYSADVTDDWREVEESLRAAYHSLQGRHQEQPSRMRRICRQSRLSFRAIKRRFYCRWSYPR